ncbi:GPI biosynthesis protein family Pig-F-domain-containing protein [Pseudoneurospora amorphoporcata]|uniref:GPI biosynthesis protein family Pig-F-domain-containing protein n=1 Tax=Pseudoneurospora amorphoporcata TaxID=241081 RepID=A0AAN6NKH4_9PEZI|nr:GPI biosynthesis protein family Pig-F-domain-containing protein [Pseudoneurospora amorphoporcata]
MPLVDPVTMSSSAIVKGAVAQSASTTKATSGSQGTDSTTTTMSTGASSSLATLRPVHIKQTLAAQTVRHALPAALTALYLLRFDALVADPVPVMRNALPVVAALQMTYALLCLPAAGEPASKSNRKPRPGEKKKGGDIGSSTIITALLASVLTSVVTPFLHFAMALFGAPFLTHGSHTFLCAAHLALLTFFPLFYVHGVDSAAWAAVGGFRAPLDETFGGLVGGLFGAWLGAVPIPLDWDREWQKWPVTILCGIYGGYLLGRILGGTLFWGKRF